MTGSCQKTEAVARLETSNWQRQLPELKKRGADHFSRLSGMYLDIFDKLYNNYYATKKIGI